MKVTGFFELFFFLMLKDKFATLECVANYSQ